MTNAWMTNPETRLRILIVEDDEHAANELESTVRKIWFRDASTRVAHSESDALNAVAQLNASGRLPHLVILDRQLRYSSDPDQRHPDNDPQRDAGLRVLQAIRKLTVEPPIPVILWTVIVEEMDHDDEFLDLVTNTGTSLAALYAASRSMLAASNHDLPPIPTSLEPRRDRIEAGVMRLAGVAAAVLLLAGLFSGAAQDIWGALFSSNDESSATADVPPAPIQISIDETREFGERHGGRMRIRFYRPVVSGLDDSTNAIVNQLINEIYEDAEQIADNPRGTFISVDSPGYVETTYDVRFVSSDALSIVFTTESFEGGAGAHVQLRAVTVDPRTGDPIYPSEFFADGTNWFAILEEAVCERAPDATYCPVTNGAVSDPTQFSFDADHIYFVFDEHEIGPGAAGAVEIQIPIESLPDIIDR